MNLLHNFRNLLFPHRAAKKEAYGLYQTLVLAARNPTLFTQFNLPDTQDGRFGFLSLHMYMAMEALSKRPALKKVHQELVDLLFDDMDANLREMGVGDLGVGTRIKVMAKTFYGGLQAFETQKDHDLTPYISNNLFLSQPRDPSFYSLVQDYIHTQRNFLDQTILSLLGSPKF